MSNEQPQSYLPDNTPLNSGALLFCAPAPGKSWFWWFTARRGKVEDLLVLGLELLGVQRGQELSRACRLLEAQGVRVYRSVPFSGARTSWGASTEVVHCKREPFDVYCGRKGFGFDGRPEAGIYGSPINHLEPCPVCGRLHQDRGDTLKCFEVWARRQVKVNPEYRANVAALYGLRLGCFCAPRRCHVDTLALLAEELVGPVVTANPFEVLAEIDGR